MIVQTGMLWPVFAQVLLTVAVLVTMGLRRKRSMAEARQSPNDPDIAMRRNRWSDEAQKVANNYVNLFELPVLFYAVAAFAMITRCADPTMIGLAWAFVASRAIHSWVHLGSNWVPWRGSAFLGGAVVVLVMWLLLAWRVAWSG